MVGYDENADTITMNDPWDRDGDPPILTWPTTTFIEAWDYYEPNSTRVNPFFGVGIYKWPLVAYAEQIFYEVWEK